MAIEVIAITTNCNTSSLQLNTISTKGFRGLRKLDEKY